MNNNYITRVPYDNYRIFHPDGTLMCFCSKKKATWYLKRNLATQKDEFHIHLNFTPNGYGDPLEILTGRKNVCVVSGSTENLTKHHVVPIQYRKHLKSAYKDKNSSDLVVLTRDVHNEYESIANDFKQQLFKEFISDEFKIKHAEFNYYKTLHKLLNNSNYNLLPPERQIFLQMKYDGIKERNEFNSDSEVSYSDCNKVIIDKIGEVNFIVLWKYHFIKYAKPKYLPDWWKPNILKVINKSIKGNKSELLEVDINEPVLNSLLIKYNLL